MGRRAKRTVKKRSKTQRRSVKAGRRRRIKARSKVGYGARLRRAKKARAKKK